MTCCCCVWMKRLLGPCRELPGACANKCCCYMWVKKFLIKCHERSRGSRGRSERNPSLEHHQDDENGDHNDDENEGEGEPLVGRNDGENQEETVEPREDTKTENNENEEETNADGVLDDIITNSESERTSGFKWPCCKKLSEESVIANSESSSRHPEIEEIHVSSPEQNLYILCTPCRASEHVNEEHNSDSNGSEGEGTDTWFGDVRYISFVSLLNLPIR